MGLTKQYLRYVPGGNVNLIADSNCNIIFVTLEGQDGRFVAVGACEHIYVWDLRLGEKVQVLSGDKAQVTCLMGSPNKRYIAAGYSDGSIKIFDLRSAENITTFVGHHSEVTCLAYDYLGHRLVSGSKDTDIIVWDEVAEKGICRFVGHKNAITQVAFMKDHNIIISSSKDNLIKFWDIENEFNFKTLVGHKSEVWSFALVKDDQYLITGCNDHELYLWKIYFLDDLEQNEKDKISSFVLENENEDDDSDMKYLLRCVKIGNIVRSGKGRVCSLVADYSGQVLGCHGIDNTIELFHFLPEEQIKKKINKRINKLKKKAVNDETLKKKLQEIELNTVLNDQINRLQVIKVSDKVKSFNLVMGKGDELRVCSVIDNNTIDLYSVIFSEKDKEPQHLRTLHSHGHRTDVRAVCFSSDNLAFATASGDSVKVWNRPTLQCIRTIKCGYALSIIFAPGDRNLIVGLKDGKMLIIDVAASEIQEEIPAHKTELWSLCPWPGKDNIIGVASGGGDKAVRFWLYQTNVLGNEKDKGLVLHKKTWDLNESITCVRISANSLYVAIALMDSTVKIFFLDNFKFLTSLYGHKSPVLCMDISSDSSLIVTGSSDRNIKIWNLCYGDCRRSLFAHDDSVTGIVFVPKTHYFFSCGKDGKVKEWDADIFQKIVTLKGHAGKAFNCAISPNGSFVASCGSDKVVRIFEKSTEILVLEDEAEEEREKQENELVTGEITAVHGQKSQILPSRKTVNSEKAAELILECLNICQAYKRECENIVPPKSMPPVPLFMQAFNSKTTEECLLETVKRIRASDIDEALLLLPYSAACEILKMLPNLLNSSYQTEIVAKLTFSLIQAHHGPLIATQELLPLIEDIQSLILKHVTTLRDIIGFNLYGMSYAQRVIEEKEGVQLFKEANKSQKKKNAKKKNKEKALKRAIMSI